MFCVVCYQFLSKPATKYCSKCRKRYEQYYYFENKSKQAQQARDYYSENRDKLRSKQREYYHNNKASRQKYQKAYEKYKYVQKTRSSSPKREPQYTYAYIDIMLSSNEWLI